LAVDDGTIDEDEGSYLVAICTEMALGFEDEIIIPMEELPSIFTTRKEQRIVLVELLALAYSNSEYHKNEKSFIQTVLKIFSLNNQTVEDIELLVKEIFVAHFKLAKWIEL